MKKFSDIFKVLLVCFLILFGGQMFVPAQDGFGDFDADNGAVVEPAADVTEVDRAEPVTVDEAGAQEQPYGDDVVESELVDSEAVPADEPSLTETVGEDNEREAPEEKRSFWSRLFRRAPKEEPEPDSDEIDEEINSILEQVKDDIRIAGAEPEAMESFSNDIRDFESEVDDDESGVKPEEIVAVQEEVRRQAREIEAIKKIDEGYSLMEQGKYEDALQSFTAGLETLPRRPATVDIRRQTVRSQAECEYKIAERMYEIGNYARAIDANRRALRYYPAHKDSDRLLKRAERMYEKEEEEKARPKPPWQEPARVEKVEDIAAFIKKGRQLMSIEEYEKAREQFYEVLRLDSKNEEATRYLKDIAEKEYVLNTDEMKTTQADMIAQVRERWSPPVPSKRTGMGLGQVDDGRARVDMSSARAELITKLNSIVIPELNFRDANIVDVVDFLVNTSIEMDPAPTRKGVNILLQRRQTGAPSAAPARPVSDDDFLFGEQPPAQSQQGPGDIPNITMSLRNMLLIDAIRYITDFSQLKYRIEDHAVIIYPADMAIGRIVTRVYSVQPAITEIIFGAGDSGGQSDDPFASEFGSAPSAERQDAKRFFVDAGVPFPEGTSIVYKPSISKLFVSNTAENLERFEEILRQLDVIPKQIQIEARFVEVAQSDLEELGVQWLLTDNWQVMQRSGAGAPIPLGGQERVQVNKNDLTRGLRYMGAGATPAATAGGNMGGLLSISSILTNPELSFILHALDRKDGVNLLSAPRVTTKSGMNAEIKIVEELTYPTEFSRDINVIGTGAGDQQQIIIVTPTGFETRDVGVILNVTPVVGPDGVTIDLTLFPQVVELAEWINYGSTDPSTGRTENMPQPVFRSRYIATSISIWDGETVVMGGLIGEAQSNTEDKIPFLGDIPLIGALFRSKTTISRKKNLMIFVTATIVDPAGKRINVGGATTDFDSRDTSLR